MLILSFLMHDIGLFTQIYILDNFYLLVLFQLNFIGQCEMYFQLIGTSVKNKNSNGNCFFFLTARETKNELVAQLWIETMGE